MDNNNPSSKGVSFFGILQLLFIAFKLLGVISWSWLLVLTPIWVEAIIVITIYIVIAMKSK